MKGVEPNYFTLERRVEKESRKGRREEEMKGEEKIKGSEKGTFKKSHNV